MTSYPCPVCLTEANLETGCPGCGRAPDPIAAEVIRLDEHLADLEPRIADARTKVEQAQSAYTALVDDLHASKRVRSQLAAQVWAAAHAPAAPTAPAPLGLAPARPETSTQTVKNVLFVLGGILLSIAAIVFTAFAWGTFGMAGKAAILGVFTLATLAVPLVALWRNLRGTAETFAALGLLLVVLDGYSIWRVNLGGITHAMPGTTYAGIVAAVTAAVAVAYGRWTKLAGPAVFGLAAAQPVLPLVFADLVDNRPAGLALVFSATAAANLPVARLRSSLLELLSLILYAVSLTIAHGYAFAALAQAEATQALALAGGVTLLVGAVVLAGPVVRPQPVWLTAAIAWCVGLTVLVGAVTATRLDRDHDLLWTVGLIAVIAASTALVELTGRGAVWRGLLIGVAATGGLTGVIVAGFVANTAVFANGVNVSVDVALLTASAVAVTRRAWPMLAEMAAAAGTIAFALALPAGFAAPWLPVVADLAAVGVMLAVVLGLRPQVGVRAVIAVGAGLLPGHAVLACVDRPLLMAYTLGSLVGIGVVTAVVGRWRDRIAGSAAVAVTGPLVVGFGAAVAWAADGEVLHVMALTAAGLPLAVWAVRRWYARVADLSARATIVVAMLIAVAVPGDAWVKSVYVAGAAVALMALPRTDLATRIAGWASLGLALLIARPPLLVVVQPYAALFGDVHYSTVALADVLAIAVLTASLWPSRPLLLSAIPVPIALALVHFGLPWPWLPLMLLVAGLLLVGYAIAKSPWCAPFGLVLAGSGLSGLTVEYWSLITGLSLVCIASAAAAVLTRVRIPSWAVFSLSWLALAITVARAADLSVAFTVLGAAAVLLLASVYLARYFAEIRVLEIPAHLAAAVVIVTIPSAARLSAVCLVWGVALGLSVFARLRAPWRPEWLLRLVVAGALEIVALWALLISRDVRAVEAYSLPLAGVALLVGFLAMRRDPTLSSWIGYGPALVAGFGPTLIVILLVTGDPWRRLGLGVAALAIVIAGAVRRRQAPVVIGGSVLIIVALHEITQVWSSLPLWLPIGIGGGILVGLAITYERRLRDLRTLRSRISSYT